MLTAVISKVVSIVMVILFALSILMLVLTFRKPKKISLPSLAITLGLSLLSLVIFSAIIGYRVSFWIWLLIALIGGTIGYVWAKTTKIYLENDQVKSQNSIWYLVVWGAVFVLNQLIIIITNRPPGIAMALLIMSTFVVWGTNGNIIQRYFRLQPALGIQTAGVPAGAGAMQATGYAAHYQESAPVIPSFSQPSAQVAPSPLIPKDPFAEVTSRYNSLKTDLDRGAISADAFRDELNNLRLQDKQGSWWQIGEAGSG